MQRVNTSVSPKGDKLSAFSYQSLTSILQAPAQQPSQSGNASTRSAVSFPPTTPSSPSRSQFFSKNPGNRRAHCLLSPAAPIWATAACSMA